MKNALSILLVLCYSLSSAQTVRTVSGSVGNPGYDPGSSAAMNSSRHTLPAGLCTDTSSRLFLVEEGGHRIKYYDFAADLLRTRSGSIADPTSPTSWGYSNQSGVSARYYYPYGIACNP